MGVLVGLQRERVESRLVGIRTFPLITILGTRCGLIAHSFGGWVVAAGFLALAATIVIGDRGLYAVASLSGLTDVDG